MTIEVIRSISGLQAHSAAWRGKGRSIGMVPTMGALHAGHLALVDAAKRQSDRVIVTLFVNPTQFAQTEDLSSYPREEEADQHMLEERSVDVLFAPSTGEMYPAGFDTTILVRGPSEGLETDFRPQFFRGVATVVAKLLLAGLPDRAFFGEKDFQQLLVVRKLVSDLNIPTEIVGCPTMREADGLALSSRNAYLTSSERAVAPRLHETLQHAALEIRRGRPAEEALNLGRSSLAAAGFAVDYLELRNAETLKPATAPGGDPLRLLVAARLGRTRLIDNVAV